MIAFLRKAERQDVMGYVHGGWVAALLAGIATWAAATYVINVSGASRELTEGFGALFAAAVLLSVGIWMHGKAQRSEEHTSELQSLMRISYAVFCWKQKIRYKRVRVH